MTFADQLTVGRALSVPVVVLLFSWDFEDTPTGRRRSSASRCSPTRSTAGWRAAPGRRTDLGRILDPVADKILVMASLIVLVPVVPGWMVALIVAREFLVSGLRLAALERGVVVPRPRPRQGEDLGAGGRGRAGRARARRRLRRRRRLVGAARRARDHARVRTRLRPGQHRVSSVDVSLRSFGTTMRTRSSS